MSEQIKRMSQEKKDRIGNWLTLLVVLLSILIPIGFMYGSDFMIWSFIVLNFVFGPLCLIFYLFEVKRGVFSYDGDEEQE